MVKLTLLIAVCLTGLAGFAATTGQVSTMTRALDVEVAAWLDHYVPLGR